MKIITRGRGTGKTRELIKESAETGRYILVSNRSHCEAVCNIARKLGLTIPYPVTVDELRRFDNVACNSSISRDGLLIDEAIMVLESLIGIKIEGATISLEDIRNDGRPKTHQLKIAPVFYEAVVSGRKKFETRVNDRNFQEGDFLVLQEYENESYTGNEVKVEITYIPDFPLPDNYVVMGIVLMKGEEHENS